MTNSKELSTNQEDIAVLTDVGSGRAFITIIDDDRCAPLARAVVERLGTRARSILVKSPAVTDTNWSGLSDQLEQALSKLQLRQVSVVGIGAGATLAQNLALNSPKSVRALAIIDASSRPHPRPWERYVDWLEERLPFGLPLRLGSVGFNSKAYLHRLRCPLLAITTSEASHFIREELKAVAAKAPTAWGVELRGSPDEQLDELTSALLAFQDTPAKCPQKNLKEAV